MEILFKKQCKNFKLVRLLYVVLMRSLNFLSPAGRRTEHKLPRASVTKF